MNRAAVKTKKKSSQSRKDSTNNAKNAPKPGKIQATAATTTTAPTTKPSTINKAGAVRPVRRASDADISKAKCTVSASADPPLLIETFGAGDANDAAAPPIRKMERAHTFFLTRKLSQIYNNLTTGSKENLSKILETEPTTNGAAATGTPTPAAAVPSPPFKFKRSLSMASIPLRQSFRRVFRDHNKLEKLHEENSTEKVDGVAAVDKPEPIVHLRVHTAAASDRKSTPAALLQSPALAVQPELAARPRSASGVGERPRRRSSFRSTLRELLTISGQHHGDRDKPINAKWSASLASLQQIDNMVSYEDLSFIDYDKFNTYEQTLAQRRTRARASTTDAPRSPILPHTVQVIRRNPQPPASPALSQQQQLPTADTNFDQPKNLYRHSLDDRKLRFLSKVSRHSFRLSDYSDRAAEDVLMLDQVHHAHVRPAGGHDCPDFGGVQTTTAVPAPIRRSPNACTQVQSLWELRSGFDASRLSVSTGYDYWFMVAAVGACVLIRSTRNAESGHKEQR